MKTLDSIKTEKNDLILFIKNETDEKKKKKLKVKLSFYNECEMYLESNPREEYLKKVFDTNSNTISMIMSRYKTLFSGVSVSSKHRAEYKKESGVSKLESENKKISFLLFGE